MDPIIREGKPTDLPTVLELVKELAAFAKLPSEVDVTAQSMEIDGFGPEPVFKFLVAESDGIVTGTAIYYFKYSTWKGRCIHLEDLIVKQEHRSQGIGGMLFEEMIAITKRMGLKRLTWQVLDWNEPAIRFYQKYNATLEEEWLDGKLCF